MARYIFAAFLMVALLHIGVSLPADTIQNEVADAPDKEIEKINPEDLIDAEEEADLQDIEDDEDEDQDSEEAEVEDFSDDEGGLAESENDDLAESEEDENSEMQSRITRRCVRRRCSRIKVCRRRRKICRFVRRCSCVRQCICRVICSRVICRVRIGRVCRRIGRRLRCRYVIRRRCRRLPKRICRNRCRCFPVRRG